MFAYRHGLLSKARPVLTVFYATTTARKVLLKDDLLRFVSVHLQLRAAHRQALQSPRSMSDPTYPLFPVFAFLGFVVSFIPLPWHLQAWNAGTCIYMFWTGFASLIQFVNSVVWNGNVNNVAPIWCDICG